MLRQLSLFVLILEFTIIQALTTTLPPFFAADPSSTTSPDIFQDNYDQEDGFFGGNDTNNFGQPAQEVQNQAVPSFGNQNTNSFGQPPSQEVQTQAAPSFGNQMAPQFGQQGVNQGFPVSNAFPSNQLPPIFGRKRR
uniref:Uncharacterized protein n=1 Tax=Caenorhabditis japonica TaxID=281687 RepID=A0A8R1E962_CAEJA